MMKPDDHQRSQNLLGRHIAKLRESRNLTQEELAARCHRLGWDISRATLSKIEYGMRRLNDAEVFLIASVLDTTISQLYLDINLQKPLPVARHGKP